MIFDANIIVIGAGAAGLMAASRLSESGKNVLLIEARDRIGGRIHTIHEGNQIFEAGAEFIHGNLPHTMKILEEAGIKYHRSGGRMERSERGEWIKRGAFSHGWGDLIKKMEEIKEDMVIADFLNTYFSGDQYIELRQSVKGFAEGFDLADISRASTRALYEEWNNESDDQYRVKGGFDQLANFLFEKCLAKGSKLLLGHEVHRVEWRNGPIRVFTNAGKSFQAEKVLVTIPLGLLQKENKVGSISFDPSLGHFQESFRDIGYGSIVKILLNFNRPFWEEHKKNLGFIISDQSIPTWWTQAPLKSNLLTGWLGGPLEKIKRIGENDLLDLSLGSLANIFSTSADLLKKQLSSSHLFNWNEDPFSLGGYSYSMPATRNALQQLKKSISRRLYFAGEALYDGDSPGTVEAALHSGYEVAGRIETESYSS
ncbi:MAG: flavin monoamine oxidase family protein [Chitinophagales bacterium]